MSFIILTGPPGIGKTTLIKNACSILKSKNVKMNGFYTEEIREGRERIGFDIINFNGDRRQLARLSSAMAKGPSVGKYTVDVNSFESIALPVFQTKDDALALLVLDEIGKMELFSETFCKEIKNVFTNPKYVILATIPIAKGRPFPLVEMIRNHSGANIIEVNRSNRDTLTNEIVDALTTALTINKVKTRS